MSYKSISYKIGGMINNDKNISSCNKERTEKECVIHQHSGDTAIVPLLEP